MNDAQKVITGIECCLGIDDRRCSACPFRRKNGAIDGNCAERLLRQALVAVQESVQKIADLTEKSALLDERIGIMTEASA